MMYPRFWFTRDGVWKHNPPRCRWTFTTSASKNTILDPRKHLQQECHHLLILAAEKGSKLMISKPQTAKILSPPLRITTPEPHCMPYMTSKTCWRLCFWKSKMEKQRSRMDHHLPNHQPPYMTCLWNTILDLSLVHPSPKKKNFYCKWRSTMVFTQSLNMLLPLTAWEKPFQTQTALAWPIFPNSCRSRWQRKSACNEGVVWVCVVKWTLHMLMYSESMTQSCTCTFLINQSISTDRLACSWNDVP